MSDVEGDISAGESGAGESSSGLSPIAMEIMAEAEAAPAAEAKGQPEGPEDPEEQGDATGVKAKDKKQDLDAGVQKAASKPEPKPETYELKANGKTYTAKNLDELKAMAQRGLATQQKWQAEKSTLETKQAELDAQLDEVRGFLDLAKKSPTDLFRKLLGAKAEDVAEELLQERVKEWQETQDMSEREKALYKEAKEARTLKARMEAEAKLREEQEATALVEQQKQLISQKFSDALTKHGVPQSQLSIRVMASIYRANLAKGVELTTEEAAELTKEQLAKIGTSTVPQTAEEFVKSHPKLAESVRNYFLEQARTKPAELSDVKPRAKDGKFKQTKKPDPDDVWEKEIEQLKREGNALRVKQGFNY